MADRRVTRARGLLTWANRVTFLTPPPDDGTSSNSSADRPPRDSRGPGIRPRWTPTTRTTGNDLPSRTRGMVNERYSRLVHFNLFSFLFFFRNLSNSSVDCKSISLHYSPSFCETSSKIKQVHTYVHRQLRRIS